MDKLNINKILNREHLKKEIIEFLNNFNKNKDILTILRGIYISGNSGVGKTYFIKEILNELNYDIVYFDGGDVRNKNVIETITKCNTSEANVINMFYNIKKPIAIVMDDIDSMNSGDKGGINALIKLIRPKKTKKQKIECISNNPIICINNTYSDKKIKELMKVCKCIELREPTRQQICNMLTTMIPNLEMSLLPNLLYYINYDLRRLSVITDLYDKNLLTQQVLDSISMNNSNSEDVKILTCDILNNVKTLNLHNYTINETDRTIVGLLWHENIIDAIDKLPCDQAIEFYMKVLKNICFSDYIDRITFQKQIWEFNEMSSLIKTFYNNKLYHDKFTNLNGPLKKFKDVRFTKVLTKYSTEYNNSTFIQSLCQELVMDKKDMLSLFNDKMKKEENYSDILENDAITKLDINRISKFIETVSD